MLFVDCCDDFPGLKATNECSGIVDHGGWRIVEVIVVGCFACTTQLKTVIFLKIGFLSHC